MLGKRKNQASGSRAARPLKAVHAPELGDAPASLPAGKRLWWQNPQALRKASEGAVFVGLVLIIGLYGSRVFFSTTEVARRRSCAANLRTIGLALQMYAQDYNDRLPPTEGDFSRRMLHHLPEVRYFICPSDDLERVVGRAKPKRVRVTISYAYRAPGRTHLDLLPDPTVVPLLWDYDGGVPAGAHRDGGNVLYADGHVRWRPIRFWSAANSPY